MRFLMSYRLLGYFLSLGVAASLAWQLQTWRYEAQLVRLAATHANVLDQRTQAALQQQHAEQDKRLALEQQLSASDQHHAQELNDAHHNQAYLRDRLATADVRLSVLLDANEPARGCAVPATATPGGVVHAAARARLDPAHAQRIIGITDDGDNALIALRACQAYVRAVGR
ncbi:lysis system i-spanin subunit Rz [Pseudomonas kitaguniensis]|uniref:lysis system i-spanin subunit Rz n=1 Tax=Pseudomonas kitaguniensis TaxID=2607908 RepID=UPI003D01B2F5